MTPEIAAHEQLATRIDRLERLAARVESAMSSLRDEVRTRQLVVVDDDDHPRIVAEVFGDVAELRLELPSADGETGSELLLFAVASDPAGAVEFGPAVGLQLRARGDAVFELDARPDARGVWSTQIHSGRFGLNRP